MTTTVKVDREACKGHGRCYMTAPDLFDCDDDGFPLVIAHATTDQEIADLGRAVHNCPEQAVTAEPLEHRSKGNLHD